MSQLDRLEQLAQRLVEGAFNRFLHAEDKSPTRPAATPAETREVLSLAAGKFAAKRWALRIDGRRLALGEPVVNVGRALDNDIVLAASTVSRYHAQLRWRNGRYYLCPPQPFTDPQAEPTRRLASAPYTRVNGRAVSSDDQYALAPGDALEFGQIGAMIEVQ